MTIEDIANKEFSLTPEIKGIPSDEVDDFLDSVIEHLENKKNSDAIINEITSKEFSSVNSVPGYSTDEVDDYLNEILEEMARREEETAALRKEIAQLKNSAPAAAPVPRTSESAGLLLTKAQEMYDEIVGEAKKKADEILNQANMDSDKIRENAQQQVSDLTARFDSMRRQVSSYYDSAVKAYRSEIFITPAGMQEK